MAEETKYVALPQLEHYHEKASQIFAKKGETGASDYEDLDNLPSLDGHELKGQLTAGGLGLATSNDLNSAKQEIEAKISTVYTPKGSVAFKGLPATPNESMVGDVYNISDAFVTDSRFLEGSGHDYPAGTNVVVTANGGSYYYDCLAGIFDIQTATDSDIDAIFA